LTVTQIKKLRTTIDEKMKKCVAERLECEKVRHSNLFEIGNWLHDSVVVSKDEVIYIIADYPFKCQCGS